MKIYKISQEQFTFMQQRPGGVPDANIELANLQQAIPALSYMEELGQLSQNVLSSIKSIEDHLGGDIGITEGVTNAIKNAAMQTSAYSVLMKTRSIADLGDISDQNYINTVKAKIANDIASLSNAETYSETEMGTQ